jgi:transposase
MRYNFRYEKGMEIMQKKAKQYTCQEKAKVAMEAIRGDLTMAQISSQYGVHATQIARWKKEAIEAMVAGFNTKAKPADPSQKDLVDQLYQQIGQLTVERDWLKKKSATFVFGS